MKLSLHGFSLRDRIGAAEQVAAISGVSMYGADFVWGYAPLSGIPLARIIRPAFVQPVCDAGVRIHGIRAGPSCKARLPLPGPASTARPAPGLAGFFLPAAQARGLPRFLNPIFAFTTPA